MPRLPLHPATTSDRMTGHSEVEILLVEDNPSDVELTLRALKARNLANQVFVARDGAEALEFFFGEQSPLRDIRVAPRRQQLHRQAGGLRGLRARRLGGRALLVALERAAALIRCRISCAS